MNDIENYSMMKKSYESTGMTVIFSGLIRNVGRMVNCEDISTTTSYLKLLSYHNTIITDLHTVFGYSLDRALHSTSLQRLINFLHSLIWSTASSGFKSTLTVKQQAWYIKEYSFKLKILDKALDTQIVMNYRMTRNVWEIILLGGHISLYHIII